MNGTPLGPGPEFDRIRAIAAAMGRGGAGLGDDCAFLPDGWCVSIDVSNEDVHFRRQWLTPREIGWRAAMAALSDLAAVAAEPVALVVGLTAPREEPTAALAETMAGVADAAVSVGAVVAGGDLTAGPLLSLAVTVLGRAAQPVRRTGARVGDGVWVTGSLGGARAALLAWQSDQPVDPAARRRFAAPIARVAEGQWLGRHGATAMIDVSDGLGGDARHLARASGVRLSIDLALLPVDPSVGGDDRALSAARGGEDYELLVALPARFDGADFRRELGTSLTRIGEVGAGAGVVFVRAGHEVVVLGFDHFG